MELAARLASLLASELPPTPQAFDRRARATGQLANALRIRNRLTESQEAFTSTWGNFEAGTRRPSLRAQLLEAEASLRYAQRRFPHAVALLNEAIAIHRTRRNLLGEAKALVHLGTVLGYAGDAGAAVAVVTASMRLFRPRQNPGLGRAAAHALMWFLVDAGRAPEARQILALTAPAFQAPRQPLIALRFRWLRAHIAIATGAEYEGEELLRNVRSGFAARSLPFEAALAGLELALLYAERGDARNVALNVAEIIPIFDALGIQREAEAAIALRTSTAMTTAARSLLARSLFLLRTQPLPERP